MLYYGKYQARYGYDADANIFHGEVVGTRDVITFQANTVSDLQAAFGESIADYLEFCSQENKAPN